MSEDTKRIERYSGFREDGTTPRYTAKCRRCFAYSEDFASVAKRDAWVDAHECGPRQSWPGEEDYAEGFAAGYAQAREDAASALEAEACRLASLPSPKNERVIQAIEVALRKQAERIRALTPPKDTTP